MTDISKEAVERMAARVGDILHREYEGNLPVGNIPPHEMEDIQAMLRALSAYVEELKQQVKDTLKISNLKREQGRLQGLDEAAQVAENYIRCTPSKKPTLIADGVRAQIEAFKDTAKEPQQ